MLQAVRTCDSQQYVKHLERHKILNDCQHGFRAKRSCETQTLTLYHELASSLDKKTHTDMIILDLSKAFDRVPHQCLIKTVHHYGIRGTTHQWISSFLSFQDTADIGQRAISRESASRQWSAARICIRVGERVEGKRE